MRRGDEGRWAEMVFRALRVVVEKRREKVNGNELVGFEGEAAALAAAALRM